MQLTKDCQKHRALWKRTQVDVKMWLEMAFKCCCIVGRRQWLTVCVTDTRRTSISTARCLWWTVVSGWTRCWDMTRRPHRRRQSASQNDDRPMQRVTVRKRRTPRQMVFITLLYVVSVIQRSESTTKTKSIISLMFLQAMRSARPQQTLRMYSSYRK